jgi:hypothetical protein
MNVMTRMKWKKAGRSAGTSNCVELANNGGVRDSKNPHGPIVMIDLGPLLSAIKQDCIRR